MTVAVSVRVHHADIATTLRDPAGPAALFVERRCQVCENFAKLACPVREGRLRNSITHVVRVEGSAIVGSVFSPLHYARFVHEGTGIYGPRRQFIYPKRGDFLVFEAGRQHGPQRAGQRRPAVGNGPLVFARRVRGTPPSRFLLAGLEAAMPGVPLRRYT